MDTTDRKDGLFALLPSQERETIYWRISGDFDELYDALAATLETVQVLEDSLSRIFRGDGFPS